MARIDTLLEKAAGRFAGTKKLWLGGDAPVRECSASIEIEARRIRYSWSYEGKPQTGTFEVAVAADRIEATWTDTWHAREPLVCAGADAADELNVHCAYGPDWGWRTEVRLSSPDEVLVEMTNIHPDGTEELAVRLAAARVAS